jgi:hypothetical protein
MDIVNEGTSLVVTLSFFSETEVAVTPTSGSYRIDDLVTGEEIIGDTNMESLGETCDILIDGADNVLLNTDLASETHVLTASIIYGNSPNEKTCTGEYRFKVRNLKYL